MNRARQLRRYDGRVPPVGWVWHCDNDHCPFIVREPAPGDTQEETA